MLKSEVQAHSRLLCAMAVHPTKPLFATASEDATVAVWSLSNDGHEVKHSASQLHLLRKYKSILHMLGSQGK